MLIREGGLDEPSVIALLRQHLDAMHQFSPEDSVHALGVERLRGPDITFVAAWDGDDLMGCGALRELDPAHGEVKSMRTADAYLRRGVAAAIVEHLIDLARSRGYERVSLETGSGASFEAAHQLYARVGFVPCGPFGDYVPDEFSRYYTLDLSR